jgi:hypothetical protein
MPYIRYKMAAGSNTNLLPVSLRLSGQQIQISVKIKRFLFPETNMQGLLYIVLASKVQNCEFNQIYVTLKMN